MMEQNKKETQQEQPRKKQLKGWQIFLLNLLAMGVVGLLLIWLTLGWLKGYTRHDEVLRVPELRGLSQEDASDELAKLGLYLQVNDSIYDESQVPGVILDSTPKAGATIKSDRTIYVTVNNSEVKQYPIPEVRDQSLRQAEALLRANGFIRVEVKYVAGQFDDLALHVKNAHGRILIPGERVPYNELLTLEVSSSQKLEEELGLTEGATEVIQSPEDIEPQDNDGEDWF